VSCIEIIDRRRRRRRRSRSRRKGEEMKEVI